MRLLATAAKLFCVVLLLCHLAGQPAVAGALSLNGALRYFDSKTAEDQFSQQYNASYSGKNSLTDLVDFGGNIRYSKSIDETTSRDFLGSGLFLNNNNDIYRFKIYGNYNFNKDSSDTESDRNSESWNWTSTLGSSWTNKLLPKLAVSYGGRGGKQDSKSTSSEDNASGRVAWNYWNWLAIVYNIDWRRLNAVSASGVVQNDLNQSAGLRANQQFFNNRLGVNLNLSYTKRKNTVAGPTADESILLPLIIPQASYEETDDPLTGALTNDASFLLVDEDPPVTLVLNSGNVPAPMNLGIRVNFQQVDVVYLTTLNEIDPVVAASFSWDLYRSNNGIDWELEKEKLPFDYDAFEQRFEFEVASPLPLVRWLKLVADTGSPLIIGPTEIVALEVFRRIVTEDGTVDEEIIAENSQAVLGLNYRLQQNLRFDYSFRYDETERNSPGSKRKNLNNNAALSWAPGRYFSSRISASDNRVITEDLPDNIGRTYTLSMSSAPLDTLYFSGAASTSETYLDEKLITRRATYSLVTTADIYTDLYSSLDLSYSQGLLSDTTDSVTEKLRLTARLRPTLTLNLDQDFSRSIEESVDSHGVRATLNWTISDIMNIIDSFNVLWGDRRDTQILNNFGLGFSPSRTHRFNLNYFYVAAGENTRHGFAGTWSWIINAVFILRTNASYQTSEVQEDEWSFSTNFDFSLAIGR